VASGLFIPLFCQTLTNLWSTATYNSTSTYERSGIRSGNRVGHFRGKSGRAPGV